MNLAISEAFGGRGVVRWSVLEGFGGSTIAASALNSEGLGGREIVIGSTGWEEYGERGVV